MHLDNSQIAAVRAAISSPRKLHIITGPAGTGKTTVVQHIADGLLRRVTLLAPTGKAASRIRDKCGMPAVTVHRELLYDGERYRRSNPLDRVTIVDEASMLDSSLLATIISYQPPRLILVGDADQLPPVGTGQPFFDLVNSPRVEVSRLTTVHRSRAAVLQAATAIRAGQMPPAHLRTDCESGIETWRMVETGPAEPTTAKLIEWIRAGYYDPQQDVILSPRYGTEDNDAGIDAINKAVRAVVNPPTVGLSLCVGDRMLCCKNFGGDDLWNGDTGTVVDLTSADLPVVRLDRDPHNLREISQEQLRECRLGYAMSVHKSQGSEFRRVFFICLAVHQHMLSRSLIYTAITRARSGCVVMGQMRAFGIGLRMTSRKRTVLQQLLRGGNIAEVRR